MGRFYRVAGPGPVLLLPLIDQLAIVDLDQAVPEWREISPEELDGVVEFLVTHYPEIPPRLTLEEIRRAMYLGEESV